MTRRRSRCCGRSASSGWRTSSPAVRQDVRHQGGGDYYGRCCQGEAGLLAGVPLVILGPGFAKETLMAKGKEKEPEMFSKAFLYHTGQSGMTGIQELMKRGMGAEVLKDSRVAEETELVEKLLEAGRDGRPGDLRTEGGPRGGQGRGGGAAADLGHHGPGEGRGGPDALGGGRSWTSYRRQRTARGREEAGFAGRDGGAVALPDVKGTSGILGP